MAIKVGMTVRTTKPCSALSAVGAEDLAEGTKGTVLSLEGDLALVSVKNIARHVYVKTSLLAGCKGRPLKAETLAKALSEHNVAAVAQEIA